MNVQRDKISRKPENCYKVTSKEASLPMPFAVSLLSSVLLVQVCTKPTGQIYLAATSKTILYYVINDISRTLNNLYQVSLVLPNAKTSEGTIPG